MVSNEDLLESGKTMGIKNGHCRDIIRDVSVTVNQFEKYASEAGVNEKTVAAIKNVLNMNRVI